MTFSQLIFDLDGTLTDPLPGMVASINYALASCGYPSRSSAELALYVGPPLEGAFSELCDTTNDQLIGELIALYRERYLKSGYAQNTPYDGVVDALNSLKDDGRLLGVCTSKPVKTASLILKHFDLFQYFDFVSGGDVGVKKAHQLQDLLSSGTIDSDALMIGDRAVDIEAAKSNQLRSAGVAWGYGSDQELSSAQPHFIIDKTSDLFAQLTQSMPKGIAL